MQLKKTKALDKDFIQGLFFYDNKMRLNSIRKYQITKKVVLGLDAIEKVLPHLTHIDLPGLDHAAAWNADRVASQKWWHKSIC